MELTGRCLCGAVRFRAEVAGDEVGACHCSMCRRQASGPMFDVLGVRSISYEGEVNITRYRSSRWGERGFCRICGTSLFFREVETDAYHPSQGTFDEQARWRFTEEIFIDSKPAFYHFANDTRKMTGAEFHAAHMADGAGEEQQS